MKSAAREGFDTGAAGLAGGAARRAPEQGPAAGDLPVPSGAVAIFSRGMQRVPHLEAFLGRPVVLNPRGGDTRICAAAGWGKQGSAERAADYARAHGMPCLSVEDGFLRSVGLGVRGARPLSLIIDDIGIYFDATRPSRLELSLNSPAGYPSDMIRRGEALLESLKTHCLSKYNDAPDARPGFFPRKERPRVLLIDQTAHDQSIRWGLAGDGSFREMFEAARNENPDAELCIKSHPDVIAGKKQSALAFARGVSGISWIGQPVSPMSLLRQVDRVYTVTSQMGFEALLLGKPVTCFGMPFYAGWGATDDRVRCERRNRRRSALEILTAAYLLYPSYIDPATSEPCEAERVVSHLALQRRRFKENDGRIYAVGFSFWKRCYAKPFLASPWNEVQFIDSLSEVPAPTPDGNARVVLWASRETEAVRRAASASLLPIWRMEDGFIRSLGLGSDFIRPWSLVLDRSGIYFDPNGASDLERMLNETRFSADQRNRATRVREFICRHRITKYNIEVDARVDLNTAGRPVILVPGQVEDDASVTRGSASIRTNEALLRAVRAANPDAFLLFKPHPDILAGNRSGEFRGSVENGFCDHMDTEHSILSCIDAADEVHTMTSLAGFDALLRGKRVTTYGTPFYAGWGLTQDRASVSRRNRTLTLDELVAGVLLMYPRYWDPDVPGHVELEDILQKIVDRRKTLDLAMGPRFFRSARRRWAKWFTYAHAVWLSSKG